MAMEVSRATMASSRSLLAPIVSGIGRRSVATSASIIRCSYMHGGKPWKSVVGPGNKALLRASPAAIGFTADRSVLTLHAVDGYHRPTLRRQLTSSVRCEATATEAGAEKTDDKSSTNGEGNGAVGTAEKTEPKEAAGPVPTGEMKYKMAQGLDLFWVRAKMFFAPPWQRVKKGSLLTLKLSGEIADQFQGRFSRSVSLPQLCQNLRKAAHDPRIMGVFIKIEPLQVGWGKIDEICRHIEYFRQSGKLCMAYMAVGGEKEYYVACACGEIYVPPEGYVAVRGLTVGGTFLAGALEKLGVEAQVQRLGKYKSAGDVFSRKDLSQENREQLTAILDDIFYNWVDKVAASRGKTREDVLALLDAGVLKMSDLKEAGWVSDTKYEDELEEKLKKLTGGKEDKLLTVDYKKYSRVKEWTLGLSGGGERIAIIRAAGGISRGGGGRSVNMSDSITSEALIKKIRQVKDDKKFKALVLRIDSPGGDALASDLIWRELRLLSEKMPVIASMADVAASGGYYMAMATNAIVAEPLTLTGSIGVITLKLNLGNLYERIGLSKELISRGRFAELDADDRPFRPEEAEYFAKSARNFYESFRGKAAMSRGMPVEKMEEVAQGRVWTGKAAKDRGLVDFLGGMPTAVAIAKHKAGLSEDSKVRLVELTRKEPSLSNLLSAGALMFGARGEEGVAMWESFMRIAGLLERLQGASSEGPQAVMDDIWVEGLGLKSNTISKKDTDTMA